MESAPTTKSGTMLRIDANLGQVETRLRRFSDGLDDLRPFWRELGAHLADEAQRSWPLRRRSGRLRRSLTWAGSRLGRGGVYEASPDRLAFGTSVFYGRFHQFGAKHTPRRPLIHVDEADTSTRLGEWARGRATAAGLEVD